MPTVDQLKGGNNENTDTVIVDPNIAGTREAALQAAQNGSNTRAIDPIKEFGFKTEKERAAANSKLREPGAVITDALGSELERAAARKKEEMEIFNDTFDQCDGEMTNEDLASSGLPNYAAMLSNPPDPLNSDLRKFTQERIKRAKEMASQDELAAMGLSDENPVNEPDQSQTPVEHATPNSQLVDTTAAIDEDDEEILNEMEDMIEEDIATPVEEEVSEPVVKENPIKAAIEKADEKPERKPDLTDEVPIYDPNIGKVTKNDIENIEETQSIPEGNPSVDLDEDDIDLDKEMKALESDEDDEDEEVKPTFSNKEKFENAKNDIKKKIIPTTARVDIRGFSIVNKPVSIDNSIKMAKVSRKEKVERWPLMNTGIPIDMKGYYGTEIDDLLQYAREVNDNPTPYSVLKLYQYIYDRVMSPKPKRVEEWMKIICASDMKHIYGAIYKASFEGLNFIPYDCTNDRCNNGFISDNKPFIDMVNWPNEESKVKFNKIYGSVPSNKEYTLYKTDVTPISDTYAISFRSPSLYDAVLVPSYLDSDWSNKMGGVVALASFVDQIYVIDVVNKSLRPLNIKTWHDNIEKTAKAKVLALAKVLKTLTSDQYTYMSSFISEINNPNDNIEYQSPEAYCPVCGTKIPASPNSALNLLFTRHRLISLAATSNE